MHDSSGNKLRMQWNAIADAIFGWRFDLIFGEIALFGLIAPQCIKNAERGTNAGRRVDDSFALVPLFTRRRRLGGLSFCDLLFGFHCFRFRLLYVAI